MTSLRELMDMVVKRGASDLHLNPGRPPVGRIHGELVSLTPDILDDATSAALCRELCDATHWEEVQRIGTTDLGLAHHDGNRFRVSVMRQRGRFSAVLRLIPQQLLSFEQIGLPETLKPLLRKPRGLILVTGPTGSGKTTSLATMIDWINKNEDAHIVTIEDPIEYYHGHQKGLVTQREVGADVPSFVEAMRRVLRQDPDVILLGEMRDLDTISAAITAAETGHLVFGTLHTTGAARTVNRIIDAFPANQQEQIRAQLSVALLAVISQVLLPRADKKGRVAAFEIMLTTPAVSNLIRKNETNKITSTIQTSRKMGMITLDDSLLELVKRGLITREVAIDAAQDDKDLEARAVTQPALEKRAAGAAWPAAGAPAGAPRAAAPVSPPSSGRKPLGQILKARNVVREAQVQEALVLQRKQGGLIGQCLVELKHCTRDDVARALAEQAGLEAVDLSNVRPDKAALAMIDASTAHTYGVLPLRIDGATLVVAIADALNTAVIEDLRFTTGSDVRAALAEQEQLKRAVEQHYGAEPTLQDAIAEAARAVGGTDLAQAAASTPVVRLLNSILHRAIKDRASDVHFEVFTDEFRIRYRVDGSLYEIEAPPGHLALPLVARIKVMSDLDITETRLPQDGRIELSIDGRPVDLRVATLPGIAGEGCVMRVLDRSAVSLDLEALGLPLEDRQQLAALTRLPHGIVLVTGPTGSGKTTTLYAMLSEANQPDVKIITTEDPVEYDIQGIVQVPINEEIGVTYARVLRTVLRQDPDKILIGEIRDAETASVAVEASLTGHTVFSTLHTNDAPSTITRLIDMGVEPFMITATLEAVVAQRLVRTICQDCKVGYEPGDEVLYELGSEGERFRGSTFHYGKGCERCHHTGYKGRTGIFEILLVDDSLREAILTRASTQELRRLAVERGMRSLRASGLALLLAGRTTIEEVLRETLG